MVVYYVQINVVPVNHTCLGKYSLYDARDIPSGSTRYSYQPDAELRINYNYGTNKYVGRVNRDSDVNIDEYSPGVSIRYTLRVDSLGILSDHRQKIDKYIEEHNLRGIINPDSVRYAWGEFCSFGRRPVFAPWEKNKNFFNDSLAVIREDTIAIVYNRAELHGNSLSVSKNYLVLGDVAFNPAFIDTYNNLHELNGLLSPYDFSQYHERLIISSGFTSEKLKLIQFRYGTAVEIKGLSPEPDEWTYDGFIYRDPDKIAKILDKPSFEFHVTLPEMVNIQLARVFVLTTILTLILTLFLKMLRPYAMPLWNKILGLNNWLLLTIILLLAVYIYIVLFHPITINFK